MKISRVILKGVNNFEDFDYSFEDEWTQSVPDSLLLMGPNGSGKTTILRSIEVLWLIFQEFFTMPLEQLNASHLNTTMLELEGCSFATIEIQDFLPESLLISIGKREHINALFEDHKNAYKYKVGAIWIEGHLQIPQGSIEWKYEVPGSSSNDKVVNKSTGWITELHQRFIQNRLGAISDFPNIVVFESEKRILLEIEDEFSATPEQEVFRWRALYTATDQYRGSIQNYLFTLKAIRPQSYERVVNQINNFLVDKSIAGFNEVNGQLMIKITSGQTHPVHLLSSGEKQVLLMLAFIARELRPGGIVLIDEPDLHLHVSLSTAFVSHLKQMAADQNGQLIIASHAPELWERFTQTERVELGSVVEVA